jgi:hypothetical protein
MQLTMYIGNRLIDIISLNPESIKADGYMKELKYKLEKAHEKIITSLQMKPVYMIETIS